MFYLYKTVIICCNLYYERKWEEGKELVCTTLIRPILQTWHSNNAVGKLLCWKLLLLLQEEEENMHAFCIFQNKRQRFFWRVCQTSWNSVLFAEGPALTFGEFEMPSLYLSAPFSPPSVLLYSAWKASASQLWKQVPSVLADFTQILVPLALQLRLGAICVRLSGREVSGGALLSEQHSGFTLGLFAAERPCPSLGRAVPTSVKWAAVRPWPGQCWLCAGNVTNYHYATDLPISEGWPESLRCGSSHFILRPQVSLTSPSNFRAGNDTKSAGRWCTMIAVLAFFINVFFSVSLIFFLIQLQHEVQTWRQSSSAPEVEILSLD